MHFGPAEDSLSGILCLLNWLTAPNGTLALTECYGRRGKPIDCHVDCSMYVEEVYRWLRYAEEKGYIAEMPMLDVARKYSALEARAELDRLRAILARANRVAIRKRQPVPVPQEHRRPLKLWEKFQFKMRRQGRRPELRRFVDWAEEHGVRIDLPQFRRFLENYSKALRRQKERAMS